MKPAGYRLAGVTSPDNARLPRTLHFVPVDKAGNKVGDTVIGTLPTARAAKFKLGSVVKSLPALSKPGRR